MSCVTRNSSCKTRLLCCCCSVGTVLTLLPYSLHCQVAQLSASQSAVSNVSTGVEVQRVTDRADCECTGIVKDCSLMCVCAVCTLSRQLHCGIGVPTELKAVNINDYQGCNCNETLLGICYNVLDKFNIASE